MRQEIPGGASISRINELGDGVLGYPAFADEEVELALGGLHFRNVDVKEPNGGALELLAPGLVTFDIQQTRDAFAVVARTNGATWFIDESTRVALTVSDAGSTTKAH